MWPTVKTIVCRSLRRTVPLITEWGEVGDGPGQFNSPRGIDIDQAGNVYVADYYNSRVQKFTSGGGFVKEWGNIGSGDGQFIYCGGIDIDIDGDVWVTDYHGHRIQKFHFGWRVYYHVG